MDRKTKRKSYKKTHERSIAMVAYLFLIVFLGMIAYFVYFQICRSEEFMNNPYNRLPDLFEDRVIRGEIVSKDGVILAKSLIDEETDTPRRIYPYPELFSFLTGSCTEEERSGLESVGNYRLLRSHQFFAEQIVNEFQNKRIPADRLVASVDYDMQEAAAEALGRRKGSICAMDPATGLISSYISDPSCLVYTDPTADSRHLFPKLIEACRSYQIPLPDPKGLTICDMTAIASMAANGGKYYTPSLIARVENHKGIPVTEHKPLAQEISATADDIMHLQIQMKLSAEELTEEFEIPSSYTLYGFMDIAEKASQSSVCFTGYAVSQDRSLAVTVILQDISTYGNLYSFRQKAVEAACIVFDRYFSEDASCE